MSNLDHVIDNRAILNDGILERPPVDSRVSADLNVITQNDRRELLDLYPALSTGGKAKTVRADGRVRVDCAAPANLNLMTNHRTGFDLSVISDFCAMPHIGSGPNPDTITQYGASLNAGTDIHGNALTELRAFCDRGLLVHPTGRSGVVIENPAYMGIGNVRRGAQQCTA